MSYFEVAMEEFDRHRTVRHEPGQDWRCACGATIPEMDFPGGSRVAREHVVRALLDVLVPQIQADA